MSNIVTNKNGIEFDIDALATDLNGKADTDLTNVTDTGTSKIVSWAMPSDKYVDLTLGASFSTYIAPANGWFYLRKMASSTGNIVWMQNVGASNFSYGTATSSNQNHYLAVSVPALKGQTVSVEYTGTGAVQFFRFIYAVGSESEAQ